MPWLRVHPRVADGAFGAFLFLLALVPAMSTQEVSEMNPTPSDLHVGGVVLLVLATLPLIWRRDHPGVVVTVIALACLAYETIDQPETPNAIAAMVAVYSAPAYGSRRTARAAAVLTAVVTALILAMNAEGSWSWVDVVANYGIFTTAWVLGDNVRQRRERLRALEERAEAAVEEETAAYATADVKDKEAFKEAQGSQIDQMVNLIYGLLGLAILIAVLGIMNTLTLSIVERTRELGLLRAVGMTRAQLRSAVRYESVLIALFGVALGLVIGLFFGWALVQALADEGFTAFRVPFGGLAVITLIAVGFGVLAAVWPAWRASKMDVLKAIATE